MDLGLTESLGTQSQQGGFLQGAGNLLGNPLVQAALATYFGAISTPKEYGLGGAIGRGGLQGLGAFSEAQRMQQTLPYLQAQAQKAQAEVPGEQARTQLTQAQVPIQQLQYQQMQQQLAPLKPEEVQAVQNMVAKAQDPEEKAFFSSQLVGLQNRHLTYDEVSKNVETYNQSKRYADLVKAYAQQQGMANTAALLKQWGMTPPSSAGTPGMGGGLSPMTGTPPTVAPPTAGTATAGGGAPSWADPSSLASGPMGTIAYDPSDGKYHVINPDGSKGQPIS